MAKNLLDVSQVAMDSFFQEYAPANAFFGLEDFARRIVDARDSILEQEFLIQYQKKGDFIINPQWLSHEFTPVKKDEQGQFYAEICTPLYEFPFDERGMAVFDVSPFGEGCAEFVRITNHQAWEICMTATTNIVFFSIEKCKILLYNFYACCDKLNVTIVASQSGLSFENQTVPDGKAEMIREIVLNAMFKEYQIKLGKISVHQDGNPNPNPNETSEIYPNLKTK